MNAFRRLLLVVYSLILLAAVGGLGALAWNQDQKLDLSIKSFNLQGFVASSDNAKYAFTAVLVAIGLVALVTLLIAIWPQGSTRRGALRMKQTDGGFVEVTPTAIESVLREELEALPEVRSAQPKVSLSGGAIDTFVAAEIEPSASIAHATRLLSTTVENTLRDHVGVSQVRRPTIRISYDEMAARPIPQRDRAPAPPPAPAPVAEKVAPATVTTTPAFESAAYPPDAAANRPPEAPRFVTSSTEDSVANDRS
jgi:hypothetical protein